MSWPLNNRVLRISLYSALAYVLACSAVFAFLTSRALGLIVVVAIACLLAIELRRQRSPQQPRQGLSSKADRVAGQPVGEQLQPTEADLLGFLFPLRHKSPDDPEFQTALDTAVSVYMQFLVSALRTATRSPSEAFADIIRASRFAIRHDIEDKKEQASVQQQFPDLEEVWVAAENFLDLEEEYYRVVRDNIAIRGTRYFYLQKTEDRFWKLRERLLNDLGQAAVQHVKCFLVDTSLLITDWVVFNPGRINATGRVNIVEEGKTALLFPMEPVKLKAVTREVIEPLRKSALKNSDPVTDCRVLSRKQMD